MGLRPRKIPPPVCPDCKQFMKAHCAKVVCGWVRCQKCNRTLDMRTGMSLDGS